MRKFPLPKDFRYSERHEWVRHTSDGNYKVGLTPFALDLLGELVYLELPQVGEIFNANDLFKRSICLPSGAKLSSNNIDTIVKILRKIQK